MKESRASRGLQPGNLTLLRPPHQLLWEGGSDKRKVARPKWKPETILFSSLDSYSPEIFHSPSPPPPLLTYYCTFCYPLDTVSLTDWLTGWLTICHSCSSNVSLSYWGLTKTLRKTWWPDECEPLAHHHICLLGLPTCPWLVSYRCLWVCVDCFHLNNVDS